MLRSGVAVAACSAAALATYSYFVRKRRRGREATWGPGHSGRRIALQEEEAEDAEWAAIRATALSIVREEAHLAEWVDWQILRHDRLELALAAILAAKLGNSRFSSDQWEAMLRDAFDDVDGSLPRADMTAVLRRDPACVDLLHCCMHYKGFLGLQLYRCARALWRVDSGSSEAPSLSLDCARGPSEGR